MSTFTIEVDGHPLLRIAAFTTRLPAPIGTLASTPEIRSGLTRDHDAPFRTSEELRLAIRDLLRWGGYKPTGRGKPASEYLVRAAEEGALSSINVAVDACNTVSLHSGIPISVVDLDLSLPPFRVAVAPPGSSYVFNAGGQEIDIGGLLCLFDAEGPCANAVRDSQRTKTRPETTATLSILWGTERHEDRLVAALAWYRALLAPTGAELELVTTVGSEA